MPPIELPAEIEAYRDYFWHREPESRIEEALAAERFVDRVGFCAALTDSRRPGPSLYIAVCGRRDAHTPRNVQKDPETSLAWTIKDELVRRGRVYYGKLRGSRSIFITPRLLPYFNTLFGLPRKQERARLSRPAQDVLKVLRKEWEMATADLREASGLKDRAVCNKAIDELLESLQSDSGRDSLRAKIYVYLDPGGRQISGRTGDCGQQGRSAPGNCAGLPARSRHDLARRTCARHRAV